MISKCYADAADDQLQQICSRSALPTESVRQLVESGFVVVPGPVSGDPFNELTSSHDEAMAVAAGPDFKIAGAATRMSDLLNYASVFDDAVFIHLSLEACSFVTQWALCAASSILRTSLSSCLPLTRGSTIPKVPRGWPTVRVKGSTHSSTALFQPSLPHPYCGQRVA